MPIKQPILNFKVVDTLTAGAVSLKLENSKADNIFIYYYYFNATSNLVESNKKNFF